MVVFRMLVVCNVIRRRNFEEPNSQVSSGSDVSDVEFILADHPIYTGVYSYIYIYFFKFLNIIPGRALCCSILHSSIYFFLSLWIVRPSWKRRRRSSLLFVGVRQQVVRFVVYCFVWIVSVLLVFTVKCLEIFLIDEQRHDLMAVEMQMGGKTRNEGEG